MGYLIENKPDQIVTSKITIASVDILTPGFIVDIPEYPAVKNYFWQVMSMNGQLANGSINYIGTSAIHVQASTAVNAQFRFTGGYMQNNVGTWSFAPIVTSGIVNPEQFMDNDKLQLHNPGTLTLGDSDLILYITAILIPS